MLFNFEDQFKWAGQYNWGSISTFFPIWSKGKLKMQFLLKNETVLPPLQFVFQRLRFCSSQIKIMTEDPSNYQKKTITTKVDKFQQLLNSESAGKFLLFEVFDYCLFFFFSGIFL